jgi:adenylate kinase family enzyme
LTAGEAKNVDNAVVLARLFNEASGQKAPSKKHGLFILRPSAAYLMKRVLIIGGSCSGKSTLARQLADRTGLPVIHLDQKYFGPEWKEPKRADWADTVTKFAARESWIMDGNFSGTFPLRMPRADTVVFLDQPTWRCLWRVVLRTVRYYNKVRPGSAPGCRERFDLDFMHHVAVWNITRRSGILARLAEQQALGKTILHVSKRKDIEALLGAFPLSSKTQ